MRGLMNKFFLLSLSILMTTISCAPIGTSNEDNSDSLPTTSQEVTSEETTSQNSTTSDELSTSEDITSETPATTDPVTSDEATSEELTSEQPSTSEETPTSQPTDPLDRPGEQLFIDQTYASAHYYEPSSYDIEEVVPPSDPYYLIDTDYEREQFHQNDFSRATSYEDAMYRTQHYLISGDVKDTPVSANFNINHLPNRQYRDLAKYRIDEGQYTYTTSGEFESYTINNLEGKVKKIYYGAAYVTLEDVAAYIFAFLDAPSNWSSSKSGSIGEWGIYKRFNNSYFSADTDKYKYEPDVPRTDFDGKYYGEGIYKYHEMDFGYTELGWSLGYSTYNSPYNDGYSITRGPVRFVYTAATTDDEYGAKYIPIEHRHVFLTYNHYNDFIEYMNYENGWGIPFGWMSAGNEYVSGMNNGSSFGKGYYEFDTIIPKTEYDDHAVYRYSYQNTLELLGQINE